MTLLASIRCSISLAVLAVGSSIWPMPFLIWMWPASTPALLPSTMPLLAPADLCLLNASFEVMNILAPLDFSDHTFDLVNIGPSGARIPRSAWPTLLHECLRVLRPGGILRLTQTDGAGSTTSPAYERFHRLTVQALHQAGCGFS